MDSLLIGSVKEDRRAELGVSLGVDISALDVCFGGFSPTVMGDMTATWDKAVVAEARIKACQQAALKAARAAAARESEPHEWVDGQGTLWEYALLDGVDARIKGCKTNAASLQVPEQIEGHPVVEIEADGCAYLSSVEEITVPDTVVSIGPCAFRGNVNLKRITLPSLVSEYIPDWFRYCKKLSYLKLPGSLEVITSRIFDHTALKELVIGEGTRDIQPGTFTNSQLESIRVAEGNPFMKTDGLALYSKDGTLMAALAVPVRSYAVAEGCKGLGKKAFSAFGSLQEVNLPDSLEVVGDFAFAHTSLGSFTAPPRLLAILEKAFYTCHQLKTVILDAKLELIGPYAFADTSLERLDLPSSIQEVGAHLADGTPLSFSGERGSFSIVEGGSLFFDGEGGLYRSEADGLHLVRLLDDRVERYAVKPGTVSIDAGAFQNAPHLTSVQLPEGLQLIGEGAFRTCQAFRQVNIPDSVVNIGREAFLDTALREILLPASLEELGDRALITHGAHHGKEAPALQAVHVGEGSPRFRMESGMLIERKHNGAERVVVYVGPDEVVRIPAEVDEVAAYAFNGSTSIKELFLSDRISTVGVRGLAVDAPLDHIHVDLREPYEGHGRFDIWPPHTDRSEQQMKLALTVPTFVNVEALFEHYDNAIINGSSFDALSESGLDGYEQAVRLIERLEDPVYMDEARQSFARRVLATGLEGSCLEMARRDDRASLRRLADLEILDAANIDVVIETVQQMQDASMTGFLLELKRERFGRRSFDLSL